MRTIKFFIVCVIAVMASLYVTSCSKEYSSPLKGQVVKDLTFESSQSSNTVTIADADLTGFTIKSSELWCTASAKGKVLTVTVQSNDTYEERQATVTVTDPGDQTTITFKVLQKQNDAILIDGSTFVVPEEGGDISVKVQSNVDYKVEIPASDTWLKLSTRASTRGLVSSTIVLTAEKNNSGNTRFSHVKVTDGKSGVSSTITVKQDITPYIEIDKKEFNLDEFGGEVKVTVASNIDVNVQFSDDWVSSAGTTDKSDFNFIQKIKVNSLPNGQEKRTATIVFTDKLGEWLITKEVKINQTLSLSLKESSIEIMVGKSHTLEAINNTGNSLTWSSSNTSVATVNSSGTVTGVGEGSATITVTSSDGKYSAKCSVTVKAATAFIKAQSTGGSVMILNDLVQYGSKLSWSFSNNTSETVILKSMQLVDGVNGQEGNIMAVDADVTAGSAVSYTTTIGLAGIHIPVTCRFSYVYNGKEYMTTAVYDSVW